MCYFVTLHSQNTKNYSIQIKPCAQTRRRENGTGDDAAAAVSQKALLYLMGHRIKQIQVMIQREMRVWTFTRTDDSCTHTHTQNTPLHMFTKQVVLSSVLVT